MTSHPIQKALVVGMIIAGGFANTLPGQTADALIRKLVEKGILTQAEATNLLAESTNDVNRALEPKTTMPPWVNSINFGGDFRARYDGTFQDDSNTGPDSATEDRHRFRYRVRYGLTANLADHFETG